MAPHTWTLKLKWIVKKSRWVPLYTPLQRTHQHIMIIDDIKEIKQNQVITLYKF